MIKKKAGGSGITGQNNNRGGRTKKKKNVGSGCLRRDFYSVSVCFCECGRMSSDFGPEIKERLRVGEATRRRSGKARQTMQTSVPLASAGHPARREFARTAVMRVGAVERQRRVHARSQTSALLVIVTVQTMRSLSD